MIYCQRITHFEDVTSFVACTLMNVQQSRSDVERWTKEAMTFLKQHKFLLRYGDPSDGGGERPENGSNSTLASSPLGRATTLSGIPPTDAVVVS